VNWTEPCPRFLDGSAALLSPERVALDLTFAAIPLPKNGDD
jgi:hypothetical protein